MKKPDACCRVVIANYLNAVDGPQDGAALYCPVCDARIVYHDGEWSVA